MAPDFSQPQVAYGGEADDMPEGHDKWDQYRRRTMSPI